VAPADAQSLAVTAARAEKLAAAARTRTELASAADPAKITELQNTVNRLQQEAENGGQQYAPLGPAFPQTSTGRRLALANWITTPQHPRTARVAVNHIWLR
ncbi:MAG: DUF1553 domain-containing protein, partial [Planctomycetaceae bacterium]